MDTDSLSFHYAEQFSDFESSNFLNIGDESHSMEDTFAIDDSGWEWEEDEREFNGDIALIPMSSGLDTNYLSTSPPIRGEFQNIMSEFYIEVPEMEALTTGIPLSVDEEGGMQLAFDISTNTSSFNLLEYANEEKKHSPCKVQQQISGGKKIDMNAQCYIVEKNKTVASELELTDSSEDESTLITPKTELIDIVDEEIPNMFPKCEPEERPPSSLQLMGDSDRDSNESENDYIDVDTVSEQGTPILQARDLNSLLEQFEATETSEYLNVASIPPTNMELFETKISKQDVIVEAVANIANNSTNLPTSDIKKQTDNNLSDSKNNIELDKTKQILSALPEELIMKIKASSKRRMIPVIDPIPSKRRGSKRPQVELQAQSPQQDLQIKEEIKSEFVQLDHDYCSQSTPYPKHPKKDSGFESAEEEEQRNILRNQPTVKGANGKLMVSLLKINTIRNNLVDMHPDKRKRKLNLEEYKKRREGFIRSCDNSQNNSPISSGRNSPTVKEDENVRLLKHQQKLMQMAAEVLKTPPKSACKLEASTVSTETLPPILAPVTEILVPPPPPRIPPDNIEVKVLVSIGVNTDVTSRNIILASKRLDPTAELEEIRPILENASTKIDNNSLISSVIENIRNKKSQETVTTFVQTNAGKQPKDQQHGEDKIIAYLDKCRPAVATRSVQIQTDSTSEITIKHKRRRSRSSEHRKSYKRRSGSNDSRYSYSSQSSSSYSSRSKSRSPSPRRPYNKKRTLDTEHLKEVEERRIIFVGGLSSSMTKETLRRQFERFGPISNISIHFREIGDNYGFVTYLYKEDAYEAVEHGNDDPLIPPYDISFGGRRIFCGAGYSDLDNVQDELSYSSSQMDDSFDNLLREAQAKLRKRKSNT